MPLVLLGHDFVCLYGIQEPQVREKVHNTYLFLQLT